MKKIITVFLVVFAITLQAQVQKTIHQTFDVEEEVTQIGLDIYDEFEVEYWASNTVMVVTKVELTSGSQHLLDFYAKEGRYDLEVSGKSTSMKLTSKDKVRRGMKYRDMMVYEVVKMKLLIPENFELRGKTQLVRKKEDVAVQEKTEGEEKVETEEIDEEQ